jgi:integrase
VSSLYLRGTSVWISYSDRAGRRHRKPTRFKVSTNRKRNGKPVFPAEALRWKRQFDEQLALDGWGMRAHRRGRVRLSELLSRFLDSQGATRAESTKRLYGLAVRKLQEILGDSEIASLTEEKLIAWRNRSLEIDGQQNTAAWIRSLSPIFSWAVSQGLIPSSPITRSVKVRQPETAVHIYSKQDLKRIFEWLHKHYGRAIVDQLRFLLLSGWRVGESCGLRWDQVDFRRNVLYHRNEKVGRVDEYPMDTELRKFFRGLRRSDDPFVFRYRHPTSPVHLLRRALDALNVKNREHLNVHTLKKTFVYNLFASGVDLATVSRLANHKSLQTTMRYYLYWDIEHLRESLGKSRGKPTR